MKLIIPNVRLRGCGFTLFPAAEEEGVDGELMRYLLSAIYNKIEGESNNQQTLEFLLEEDLPESPDCNSKMLLDQNLVTKNETGYTLTPRSIKILARAAEIQEQLDNKGFHFCPCHPYY